MNIAEYIESGILESYALGLCSDTERAEVEAALKTFPELRAELDEIEANLFTYAQAHAVTPTEDRKAKVMAAIQAQNDTPVLSIHSPTPRTTRVNWLAAASIALLIASGVGNFMLYDKYQGSRARVLALENEKSVLANDLDVQQARYKQSSDMLAMISDPATRVIEMKGVPNSPDSKALVYWNQVTADVYVAVASLPQAPSEMQYQLWAIVDGVPVDAGMMDIQTDPHMPHKMKSFPDAQAFAVTLEKKGGSPVPTMENMFVMGPV